MKPIDFDGRFKRFALDWLRCHPGLKEDEIDASYNDMLAEWREQPADWLDGATPAAYFRQFDDADELAALLPAYDAAKYELPEPLYSRLVELGEQAAAPLTALAGDAQQPEGVRATALSLLADIGSALPRELCADILANAGEAGELSELDQAAARLLTSAGAACVPLLLQRFDGATEGGKDAILDVLCNFPGDPRIYDLVEYRFLNAPERRALYATYLAKLGDERALEPLRRIAEAVDLTYYDYLEIVNAIEALGGEVEYEREFYGDPDYEALRFI